jgi:hypothetical protein
MQKALFLLLFFPAFLSAHIKPLSPANCDLQKDSIYASNMLDSLRKDISEDERTTIQSADFAYAPGNWFKILIVSEESCGAYCNPLYYSWIFYENDGELMQAECSFNPIDAIYLLKRDASHAEFLVMDRTWDKPRGVETEVRLTASLLILDDTLHHGKFVSKTDPLIWQETIGAGLSSFCGDSADAHSKENLPVFHYDLRSRTITYKSFAYTEGDWDHCYLIGGTYKYKKGKFVETESYDLRPKFSGN